MKNKKNKLNIFSLNKKIALGLSAVMLFSSAVPAFAFDPATTDTINKIDQESKKILNDESILKHLMGTRFVKHAEGMQYDVAIDKNNAVYFDGKMYTRDGMRVPSSLISETSWYDVYHEVARRNLAKKSVDEKVAKSYIDQIKDIYQEHGFKEKNDLTTDGEYSCDYKFINADGSENTELKELFSQMSITKWGNDLDIDFITNSSKVKKIVSLTLNPFKGTLDIPVTLGNSSNPDDKENINAMSISIPAELDSSKIVGVLKYVDENGKEHKTAPFGIAIDYKKANKTRDINSLYKERTKARLKYWIIRGEKVKPSLQKNSKLYKEIDTNLAKLKEIQQKQDTETPDLTKILELSVPTYKAESLAALKDLLYNKLLTHRNIFYEGMLNENKYTKESIEKYKKYLDETENYTTKDDVSISELVTKIAELDFSMNNGILKYNTANLEELIKKAEKQKTYKEYYTTSSFATLENALTSANAWVQNNKDYSPKEDETSTHIESIKNALKTLVVKDGKTLPSEAQEQKQINVSFNDATVNKMLEEHAKETDDSYILSFKKDGESFITGIEYHTKDGEVKSATVLETGEQDSLKGTEAKKISLPKDYDKASGLTVKYYDGEVMFYAYQKERVDLNVMQDSTEKKEAYDVEVRLDKQFPNADPKIPNELIQKTAKYDPNTKILTLNVNVDKDKKNYVKQIQFTQINDSFAKGKDFADDAKQMPQKFDVKVDITKFNEINLQQFDCVYNGENKHYDALLKLVFVGKQDKQNKEKFDQLQKSIETKLTELDKVVKQYEYLLSPQKMERVNTAKTFADTQIKAKDLDKMDIAISNIDDVTKIVNSYKPLDEKVKEVKAYLTGLDKKVYKEDSIKEATKKVDGIVASFKKGENIDLALGVKNVEEAKDLLKKDGHIDKETLSKKIAEAENLLKESKKEEEANQKLQTAITEAKEKMTSNEENVLDEAYATLENKIAEFKKAEDKKEKEADYDKDAITVNVQFLRQSQDIKSMADGALWSKAKLTKDSDGKYWIEIKMVPMENKEKKVSGVVTNIKYKPFSGGNFIEAEKTKEYTHEITKGTTKKYPGRFKMPLDLYQGQLSPTLLVQFTYDAIIDGQVTQMTEQARLALDTNQDNMVQGFGEAEFKVDKKGLTEQINASQWYLKQQAISQALKDKIKPVLETANKVEKNYKSTQEQVDEQGKALWAVNELPGIIYEMQGKISFIESYLETDYKSGKYSKKSLDRMKEIVEQAKQFALNPTTKEEAKKHFDKLNNIEKNYRVNTDQLEEKIKEAKEKIKDESKYTKESVAEVKKQVQIGENLIDKEGVNATQVNAAIADIVKAVNNLTSANPTPHQDPNKVLQEAKTKAIAEVNELLNLTQTQRNHAIEEINKANNIEAVNEAKAEARELDKVNKDKKLFMEAKAKAIAEVKELKNLSYDEKTAAIKELDQANTNEAVKAALDKAKELDKKHGTENPSVTPNPSPTPDVTPTPTPDVTPTPTPEVKAGWEKDEKGTKYQRANGSFAKAEWEPVNGTWYHFDENGYMQTGWLNLDGTWYYLNDDGSMAKDTWIGTYYVDGSGAWVIEGWQENSYGWWYQRANGTYPHSEWEIINGTWYYFDANGYMLADEATPDGYYVDANGAWIG